MSNLESWKPWKRRASECLRCCEALDIAKNGSVPGVAKEGQLTAEHKGNECQKHVPLAGDAITALGWNHMTQHCELFELFSFNSGKLKKKLQDSQFPIANLGAGIILCLISSL